MDARLNDSYLRAVLAERRAGATVRSWDQRPRHRSGPVRRFAAHQLVHLAGRLDRTAVRDRTHTRPTLAG
jgi:hypothetical protein